LPKRGSSAENAWLGELREADEQRIIDCVKAAVHAGRPALASRAVGLLSEDQDDPVVLRAQQAARLLCVDGNEGRWEQLDDALELLRRHCVSRLKERHRKALEASPSLFGLATPRRRKRRR